MGSAGGDMMAVLTGPVAVFLLASGLLNALYLLVMVLLARICGLGVRSCALGVGPEAFRIGNFHLKIALVGASIDLLDPHDTAPSDDPQAPFVLDRQPFWMQLMFLLGAVIVPAASALALLGMAAPDAMQRTFGQAFWGALLPLGEGQVLVASVASTLAHSAFPVVVGLMAAKMAALNLLPLPNLSGGAVLRAIGIRLGVADYWPVRAEWLILPYVLATLSWMLAVLYYVFS